MRALDPTRAPISKSSCFFFQKEALSFRLGCCVACHAVEVPVLRPLPDADPRWPFQPEAEICCPQQMKNTFTLFYAPAFYRLAKTT
jgi:hypothetical protein